MSVPTPPNAPNAPQTSAASPEGGGLAVLDAKALDKLRELDPKGLNHLFERVLGAYAQSLQKLLMNLPAEIGPADAESVRQITHTLKSSSASVGALHMAVRCAETEKAAKEGDQALWQSNVPLLRAEAHRLLDGLTEAGYVADKIEKGVSR
jgi:HPt (histidine-containing phosphotransfer) domain-containing protein